VPDGFDEEDFELQAALQASLGGHDYRSPQNHGELASSLAHEPGPSNNREEPLNEDPVGASMERNKFMLQRIRQQQEYAQREAWSYTTEGMTPEQIAAQEARREARRKEEEEEEENLQRAIAESEAMARRDTQANDNARGGFSVGQSRNLHGDDNDAELQAALRASLEQANGISSTSHSHHDDLSVLDSSVLSDSISSVEPLELLTVEEMRRKRLAKFGA
jgi:ataxin-3